MELFEIDHTFRTFAGMDDAIMGYGERCGLEPVLLYDYNKMIAILAEDMSHADAVEWVDYNILDSYWGEDTPIIVTPK